MEQVYGFLMRVDEQMLIAKPESKYHDELMREVKRQLEQHYGELPDCGQIRPFAVLTERGRLYQSSIIYWESAVEVVEELEQTPQEGRWQWARWWMMREVAYDLQYAYDGIYSELLVEGESVAALLATINREVPPILAALYSSFTTDKFESRAERMKKSEAALAGEPPESNRRELAVIFEHIQTSDTPPFLRSQFIPEQYRFYDTRPQPKRFEDPTPEPKTVGLLVFAQLFTDTNLDEMMERGKKDPILNQP